MSKGYVQGTGIPGVGIPVPMVYPPVLTHNGSHQNVWLVGEWYSSYWNAFFCFIVSTFILSRIALTLISGSLSMLLL